MSMLIASHSARLVETCDPTKIVRYPGKGWEPRTLSTKSLMGRGKTSVIGTANRDTINRTTSGQKYGRRSSNARWAWRNFDIPLICQICGINPLECQVLSQKGVVFCELGFLRRS